MRNLNECKAEIFRLSEKRIAESKIERAKMMSLVNLFARIEAGEIKKYQVPDKHKTILDKLDVLMEDLDVDAIKELLNSAI